MHCDFLFDLTANVYKNLPVELYEFYMAETED